jgi:3-deoxy-D-manno-octulosonic-acid transferase
MRWLYNGFIYCYSILIFIVSFFNPKAKLWIIGRRNSFDSLLTFKKSTNKPIIWIHCASLGEFEQGRPLIEHIHNTLPHYSILLTFFSPSGYEIRKDYNQADFICYLPSDTIRHAKRFLNIVNPEMAVFVKYEYWFNYMHVLQNKSIPLYVISAIFRPNQHFFKSYGSWFANQLKAVTYFYTQNEVSVSLLKSLGIDNALLCGDTRFDRVLKIAENATSFPIIDAFCNSKSDSELWVVGSSWQPDEILLASLLNSGINIRLIIAPHEIHSEHLNQISQYFKNFNIAFYSKANPLDAQNADILVIDNIGLLSQIYKYGQVAYIGGGFGSGIHNILEAAAYQIPVIFGPKYQKFDEAVYLTNAGGAFPINSSDELLTIANKLINDKVYYHTVALICKQFVEANKGSTQKIIDSIWK